MWTRLDELDVEVLWRLPRGSDGDLHLLLDDLLLLLFQLIDEVMGQL